ncbi:MAG: DUF2341 domain-containing protein, partial [Candidatus Aenigmatarchaeota archaeon]
MVDAAAIAEWKFNEWTGTTALDFVGTHTGTLQGATRTTGIVRNALDFSGSTYVSTNNYGSEFFGSGPFTVSAWIRADATNSYRPIVCAGNPNSQPAMNMWLQNSKIRFILRESGGTTLVNLYSTTTIATGSWYHVAVVRSGSSMKIYINGKLDNSITTGPVGNVGSTTYKLMIGKMSYYGYYFDGKIDEVVIHNTALSAEEISYLNFLGTADQWQYKRKITLSSATQIADQLVKVQFTPSNFDYSKAKADGADIRLTDGSRMLPYWIDRWVPSGLSTIWVRVPASGTSTFYMYYGNALAASESNSIDVDMAQLKEHGTSASYDPDISFSDSPGTKIQASSTISSIGEGYVLMTVPKESINGRYLRWNWEGSTSLDSTSPGNIASVTIYDGSYVRSSSADFPEGADMVTKGAGQLQSWVKNTYGTWGPETMDQLIDVSTAQNDVVTIRLDTIDSWADHTVLALSDWFEINRGARGLNNLLRIDFNKAVSMETTGTLGDYGLYMDTSVSLPVATVGGELEQAIAEWKFNEGSGTAASDSIGSNTGTVYGDATWIDGKEGKALSFDGVNDYVYLPSVNPTNAISVEAWVKSSSSSGYTGVWQLVSKYSAYVLGVYETNGNNMCFIIHNGGWVYESCYVVPDPQNWHHFVGTYDSVTGVKNLYMDGVLRATYDTYGAISADTGPIHIAHMESDPGSSYFMGGMVDNIRIWDYALSPSQVQAVYSSYSGGPVPPPPMCLDYVVASGQTLTVSTEVCYGHLEVYGTVNVQGSSSKITAEGITIYPGGKITADGNGNPGGSCADGSGTGGGKKDPTYSEGSGGGAGYAGYGG